MKNSRWFGLTAGVLLAAALFGVALWQGTAQSGTAFAQGVPTGTPAPHKTGAPGEMMTAFWNALAAQLGIGVDTLKTKAVAAQKDVIEQQVKDGKLTREQADALLQRVDADGFPPFFGRGGPDKGGPHGGPFGGEQVFAAEAKALNLSVDELKAQLQSGKTLAQIAQAQNVSEAALKQAIIDAMKAQIASALQEGKITQAQADAKVAQLTPDKIDLNRAPGAHGPKGNRP